jgi:hypothetical protein
MELAYTDANKLFDVCFQLCSLYLPELACLLLLRIRLLLLLHDLHFELPARHNQQQEQSQTTQSYMAAQSLGCDEKGTTPFSYEGCNSNVP